MTSSARLESDLERAPLWCASRSHPPLDSGLARAVESDVDRIVGILMLRDGRAIVASCAVWGGRRWLVLARWRLGGRGVGWWSTGSVAVPPEAIPWLRGVLQPCCAAPKSARTATPRRKGAK